MMMTSIVSAQECDPGICAKIPGTIYNKELDQCAWADEVPGCGAQALGYSTDCEGMSAHELKPVDFEFPDGLQENRNANQYFVVCVNQATDEDVQLYSEAREKYGRMVHLVANGPLVPRVLDCPGTMTFDAESSLCVDEEGSPISVAPKPKPTPVAFVPKPTPVPQLPAQSDDADLVARIIAQLTPFIKETVTNSLVA